MNLQYSIPGKIYWVQNFLDRDTYKGIHNAIIKERNQINLKPVTGVWPKKLTKGLIIVPYSHPTIFENLLLS